MCLTEVATCLAWQLSQPHLVHLVCVAVQGTESVCVQWNTQFTYVHSTLCCASIPEHSVLERLHVCVWGGDLCVQVCVCVLVCACMHVCVSVCVGGLCACVLVCACMRVYMHGCGQWCISAASNWSTLNLPSRTFHYPHTTMSCTLHMQSSFIQCTGYTVQSTMGQINPCGTCNHYS